MVEMHEDTDNDRLFVTALARGLDVLAAFRAGDRSLGNAELVQRTGLPKSTIFRLTHTLVKLGYLSQDASGKYLPAPAVLTLGYAALSGLELRERAREPMRAMSTETGLSVTLGVQSGSRVVYIETHRAPTRVSVRLDVGSTVPIATTAIGRSLYAGMDDDQRSSVEAQIAIEYQENWPTVASRLEFARQEFEANGFCSSFGEYEPDIFAVATPMLQTNPAMAISCSGPAYRLSKEKWLGEIGPRLVDLANQLTGLR